MTKKLVKKWRFNYVAREFYAYGRTMKEALAKVVKAKLGLPADVLGWPLPPALSEEVTPENETPYCYYDGRAAPGA